MLPICLMPTNAYKKLWKYSDIDTLRYLEEWLNLALIVNTQWGKDLLSSTLWSRGIKLSPTFQRLWAGHSLISQLLYKWNKEGSGSVRIERGKLDHSIKRFMDSDGLQWRQRNMIFGVIYYHGPFFISREKTWNVLMSVAGPFTEIGLPWYHPKR